MYVQCLSKNEQTFLCYWWYSILVLVFFKGKSYPRPPLIAISRPPLVNFRNTANKRIRIVTVVTLYSKYRIFLSDSARIFVDNSYPATSQFPLVKPRERQLYLTVLHTLYYFPHLLPSMDSTAEHTDGPISEVGIFTGMSASEHEEHGYDKQLNQRDYYRC